MGLGVSTIRGKLSKMTSKTEQGNLLSKIHFIYMKLETKKFLWLEKKETHGFPLQSLFAEEKPRVVRIY